MRTVDAVDDDIRFNDCWGDQQRYVFIPGWIVADDAGRRMTRDEAISFVRANLDRYRHEARVQHGEGNAEKIVILAR